MIRSLPFGAYIGCPVATADCFAGAGPPPPPPSPPPTRSDGGAQRAPPGCRAVSSHDPWPRITCHSGRWTVSSHSPWPRVTCHSASFPITGWAQGSPVLRLWLTQKPMLLVVQRRNPCWLWPNGKALACLRRKRRKPLAGYGPTEKPPSFQTSKTRKRHQTPYQRGNGCGRTHMRYATHTAHAHARTHTHIRTRTRALAG